MNNLNAKQTLDNCLLELENIQLLIGSLGPTARPVPYLKKYSVIRASGSIESSFKTIIADKVDGGSHQQLKNFIKRKIRDSSSNPRFEVIVTMLSEFDSRWKKRFMEKVSLADRPRLVEALKLLVEARNSFAHGGDPDLNISDTISHFKDGIQVMMLLDEVVHDTYEEPAEEDEEEGRSQLQSIGTGERQNPDQSATRSIDA